MKDLASKIISITDSQSAIKMLPLPVDDPSRRKPDISKANTLFSWNPSTVPESGLLETVNYFRNVLELDSLT
jgi:UDP-glucuronate decarboxylase